MGNLIESARELEKAYNVSILKVSINGNRWCFEGNYLEDLPLGVSKKIKLSETCGVVVYNWDKLNSKKQLELEKKIKAAGESVI